MKKAYVWTLNRSHNATIPVIPYKESEISIFPSPDPWYRIYHMKGLYAIHEFYHAQGVMSYLIEGENRDLLLDTGLGISNIRNVVRKLTDKPISVVLSHTHFDHIGGLNVFDDL